MLGALVVLFLQLKRMRFCILLVVFVLAACTASSQRSLSRGYEQVPSMQSPDLSRFATPQELAQMEEALEKVDMSLCEKPVDLSAELCPAKQQVGDFCQLYAGTDLLENLQVLDGQRAKEPSQLYLSQFTNPERKIYPFRYQDIISTLEYLQKNTVVPSAQNIPYSLDFYFELDKQLNDAFLKNDSDRSIKSGDYELLLKQEFLKEHIAKNGKDKTLFAFAYSDLKSTTKKDIEAIKLPNFSYETGHYSSAVVHLGINETLRLLDSNKVVNLGICGAAVKNKDGKTEKTKECGPHQISVVAKEMRGDECTLTLKNSWGQGWARGGLQTYTLSELIQILQAGRYLMLHLNKETHSTTKNQMNFYLDAPFSYRGETKAGRYEGQGRLTIGDNYFAGTFEGGVFRKGRCFKKITIQDQEVTAEGECEGIQKNGWTFFLLNGHATMYNLEGKIVFEGLVKEEKLYKGVHTDYSTTPPTVYDYSEGKGVKR